MSKTALLAVGVAVLAAACASGTDPAEFLRDDNSESATENNVPERDRRVPEPGDYAYRGSGEEAIDEPTHLTHSQGPDVEASVVPVGDGCWDWRVVLNPDHLNEHTFCRDASGKLTSRSSSNEVTWSVGPVEVTNQTDVVCDPPVVLLDPSAAPGATHETQCTGQTSEAGDHITTAKTTFIGSETLGIGSEPIDTAHVLEERNLTGETRGTSSTEWWFQVDTGVVMRARRTVKVVSASFIGDVTYTESGTIELAEAPPQP